MAKAAEKKKDKGKELEEQVTAASATARFVRISPRKLRLVTDMVRGKSVADARSVLAFTPRGGSVVVEKVISSAVANAENNYDMSGDDLYVSSIYVNEGPTLKRFRPRAMGRASQIRKRTSHITVIVTERKEG
ncbi:MAG: 50S ribosomal protein L22 [Thermoleophilia bacterium]